MLLFFKQRRTLLGFYQRELAALIELSQTDRLEIQSAESDGGCGLK